MAQNSIDNFQATTDPNVDTSPKIGSLLAKMKIYNVKELDLREALRSASDSGVDPLHHAAVVEYLRKSGRKDMADYIEGIGDAGYRDVLSHYGIERKSTRESDVEDYPPLPKDEEVMDALLGAFEQDVNIGDKQKLIKWLNRSGQESVAAWIEAMSRSDFYKLLSSFFSGLGKIRASAADIMASKEETIQETVKPAEKKIVGASDTCRFNKTYDRVNIPVMREQGSPPTVSTTPLEPKPEEPVPDKEPSQDALPQTPHDIHTIMMDMYLEGVDITRRAVLVGEMAKSGYDTEAEFVDSLSLTAFYNLLSDFFQNLAKAMRESKSAPVVGTTKTSYNWHKIGESEIKSGERKMATTDERMQDVQQKTWDSMEYEDRVQALIDGGMSEREARRNAEKSWDELSLYAQNAFDAALKLVAEKKRGEIDLPLRRKKLRQMMSKVEAPEELLPVEAQEAVDMAMQMVESLSIEEAASKVAASIGRRKEMPEKLIDSVRKFLVRVLSEVESPSFGATTAKEDPLRAKEEPEGKKVDSEKEPDEKKDIEDVAKESDEIQVQTCPAGFKWNAATMKCEPETKKEVDPVTGVDDPKGMESSIDEMLHLAFSPPRMKLWGQKLESLRPPKGILIESITGGATTTGSAGIQGAPVAGMLDVLSYGGYLQKALPYLLNATMSRMDAQDKAKFMSLYHQFSETNDILQLTDLAGRLADTVEWADATQEGAELVKTFRFMGDFLNMMRASVDFAKKALFC